MTESEAREQFEAKMQADFAESCQLRHIEWDDWELAWTLGHKSGRLQGLEEAAKIADEQARRFPQSAAMVAAAIRKKGKA